MAEEWVIDASPLIVLAKVNHLSLITQLAGTVYVPATVATEIKKGPPTDAGRLALEAGWGHSLPDAPIPDAVATLHLDAGETAVLALALARGNSTVVLDDGKARRAAKALGLPVIGTLGIILRARQQGYLSSAVPVLRKLRAEGVYIEETLLQTALAAIGETWP